MAGESSPHLWQAVSGTTTPALSSGRPSLRSQTSLCFLSPAGTPPTAHQRQLQPSQSLHQYEKACLIFPNGLSTAERRQVRLVLWPHLCLPPLASPSCQNLLLSDLEVSFPSHLHALASCSLHL